MPAPAASLSPAPAQLPRRESTQSSGTIGIIAIQVGFDTDIKVMPDGVTSL